MTDLIAYFLPVIVVLGAITSYDDYKTGKIRNRHIVTALALSAAIHTILSLAGVITFGYILLMMMYVALALLIGLAGYWFSIWSAGDAKLYIAFVSLIPATVYKNTATHIVVLDILINAIIPLSIYLLIKILIKTNTKQKIKAIKKTIEPKILAYTLLAIFVISWATRAGFTYFGIQQDYVITVIILFMTLALLQRIFSQTEIYALLTVAAIIRIATSFSYIKTTSFIVSFSALTTIIISMSFAKNMGDYYYRKKDISELTDGQILTNKTIASIKRKKTAYGYDALTLSDAKLTKESANALKTFFKNHDAGIKLEVKQTMTFAGFLFAGVLITLASQGNSIIFILSTLKP